MLFKSVFCFILFTDLYFQLKFNLPVEGQIAFSNLFQNVQPVHAICMFKNYLKTINEKICEKKRNDLWKLRFSG